MQSDWLHPLAAHKASRIAFASSLTLTDFELCRNFSNKIKKKIQKRNKKKRLRLFWVKPLVVSYVCVPDFPFSCTFIFVSRTCKSALLNKLAMHHR